MHDRFDSTLNLAVCIITLTATTALFAASNRPKSWERKGPIEASPKRVTDAYPLSDQVNQGDWVQYGPMTDEFEGKELDSEKWWPRNPRWLGRQPGWFDPANVEVSDGKLHLTMRKNEPPEMPKNKGYHTYTSAAVQSKGLVRYGYFQVRCRPMASAGSSSFWFYHRTSDLWTEIDVFEIGGKAPKFEKKYNMNVHVFKTPTENKHWSKHGAWYAPTNLTDAYHTYALEWNAEKIKWYFDGVLVRWVENTHWHQPLTLNFDSETMPDWFGLPKDEDLPSTYSIEYVRAWKTHDQILASGPLILGVFGAKGKEAATAEQIAAYKRIFARIDGDGDKKISQADYVEKSPYMTPQARRHIFAASDSNADGILTEQEYIDNRAITDEAKAIYEEMDEDRDGILTKQEFLANTTIEDKALAEKIFRRLDANGSEDQNIPEHLRTWGKWARGPEFPSENSKQKGRSREEPDENSGPLFSDVKFQQGFLLSYPSPSRGRAVEAVLDMGDTKKKPVWRLCQWATKHSLAEVSPTKNNMVGITYENKGKSVLVGDPDLPGPDLILEIKGNAEYGQTARKSGQAWPHLLVEQDTTKIYRLDTLDAVDLNIGFKLLYCKNNMPTSDYNPDLHAAQFQLFFIVKNVEKRSKDFGDFFWFGVPFFDNRHEIPPAFVAKDAGKDDATGKLIYTIDGRTVNSAPPIKNEWITVKKNLLPHIKVGLKEAIKRGYLSDSALDHYAVANMNLGWEIPGNFNASAAIKDFNISARLKKR